MSLNEFFVTFNIVSEEFVELLFLKIKKGYNYLLLTLFEMKNFEEFTVNEIIQSDYRARLVFENLGIDISRDKSKTLEEICKNYKVSHATVMDKIIEEMEEKSFIPLTILC